MVTGFVSVLPVSAAGGPLGDRNTMLSLLMGVGMVAMIIGSVTTASEPDINVNANINVTEMKEIIQKKVEDIAPVPTSYPPQPSYIPILRPYVIDKTHDIWHAKDPSSYITNNEWVKYYANISDELKDDVLKINYITDNEAYNFPPNGDIWQNADYTLWKGSGDCEDISIARASVQIAKGRKAMVVAGYMYLPDGRRITDIWYEMYVNDTFMRLTSTPIGYFEGSGSVKAEPKYMFNDKVSWREYNANWYNN